MSLLIDVFQNFVLTSLFSIDLLIHFFKKEAVSLEMLSHLFYIYFYAYMCVYVTRLSLTSLKFRDIAS